MNAMPHDPARPSGDRLAQVLEAVGMTGYQLAGYWAGFELHEFLNLEEVSERGRRFRAAKRAMHRWLTNEYVMNDDSAYEVMEVANRLLSKESRFPRDFLVTPIENRHSSMLEIQATLNDVLVRLERLERKAR